MTLDGIMIDRGRYIQFTFTVGCVRAKASVHPHVYDEVSMHITAKGYIFDSICRGCKNNGIVSCDSRQDWSDFVTMYKT